MFVLSARRWFKADAEAILPPAETSGDHIRETFKLHFELLDDDQLEALSKITADDLADPNTAAVKADRRVLRRVIMGWEDVVDTDGEQIAFSPEMLEDALRLAWFRLAAYAAYRRAVESGEAARGN